MGHLSPFLPSVSSPLGQCLASWTHPSLTSSKKSTWSPRLHEILLCFPGTGVHALSLSLHQEYLSVSSLLPLNSAASFLSPQAIAVSLMVVLMPGTTLMLQPLSQIWSRMRSSFNSPTRLSVYRMAPRPRCHTHESVYHGSLLPISFIVVSCGAMKERFLSRCMALDKLHGSLSLSFLVYKMGMITV